MIRLFKHYIPTPLLVLGFIEFLLLLLSAEVARQLRMAQIGLDPSDQRFPEVLTFAVVMSLVMLAVGLYQYEGYRTLRMTVTRLLAAFAIGLVVLSVVFYLLPDVALWRSIFLYAALVSFAALIISRSIFSRLVNWDRLRRRVLILGAGQRAAKLIEVSQTPEAGFQVVDCIQMTNRAGIVDMAVPREQIGSIFDFVWQNRIDNIVLALEERRGALPIDELLRAKLSGIHISEMSTFLERETGRVDLGSVSPSWLIFSDGFLGAQRRAVLVKRLFDIVASSLLLALSSPILIVTALLIKLTSPGPILYRQERVGQLGRPFDVIKFRSMTVDAEKDGKPQWAQQHDPRTTPVGRIIRATRIDEIPQIFCVLKGDMSFVGPRPERPFFVQDLAEQIPFYNERHIVKPGITGWAQLNYPYGASVEDARHKLEYDLYYVKNYSLFLDLLILIQTVRVVLWRDGVR